MKGLIILMALFENAAFYIRKKVHVQIKEADSHVERSLFMRQTKPIYVSKKAYFHVIKANFHVKEAYVHVNEVDLHVKRAYSYVEGSLFA